MSKPSAEAIWTSSTWEGGDWEWGNQDQVYIEEGTGKFDHLFYVCNTCHGCATPVTREDLRHLRDVLNATDLEDVGDTSTNVAPPSRS
jgi:hypothetical protein